MITCTLKTVERFLGFKLIVHPHFLDKTGNALYIDL